MKSGFYCEILVDQAQVRDLIKKLDIDLDPLKYLYHITLMYDPESDFKEIELKRPDESCKVIGFDIFKDSGKDALVALIESNYIMQRHSELESLGFHHSFDKFIPHITLGYLNGEINLDFKVKSRIDLICERIDIIRN
jgi:hypothetical protein